MEYHTQLTLKLEGKQTCNTEVTVTLIYILQLFHKLCKAYMKSCRLRQEYSTLYNFD